MTEFVWNYLIRLTSWWFQKGEGRKIMFMAENKTFLNIFVINSMDQLFTKISISSSFLSVVHVRSCFFVCLSSFHYTLFNNCVNISVLWFKQETELWVFNLHIFRLEVIIVALTWGWGHRIDVNMWQENKTPGLSWESLWHVLVWLTYCSRHRQ